MNRNFFLSALMNYKNGSSLNFYWFKTEEELKHFIKVNEKKITIFEAIEIIQSRDIEL